jgi:DUF917 family protein
MKTELTHDVVEAAVLGGTILGGGGGGRIDMALDLARLAVTYGTPQLWSLDELEEHGLVAVVAAVGAPGAPHQHVTPAHYVRSLETLRGHLRQRADSGRVIGLAANENGAVGTINGWLQASVTGLPVLDAPCNGRAHPTALMGSLGLHRDEGYVAAAGFSGGSVDCYLEGAVSGRLREVSRLVRAASIGAGGLVAVARNPVPVSRLAKDGAPGGISQAIHLGQVLQARGVAGVVSELGGQVIAEGVVDEFTIEQRGGFDVGRLRIGDVEARFVNEYISVDAAGERVATFPELAMTFETSSGRPLVSAEVAVGLSATVVVAPRDALLLSTTMDMPELMAPVLKVMGRDADE